MFNILSVPRAANRSYFGLLTEKDANVEYTMLSPQKFTLSVTFREGTTELVALNGEFDKPVNGVYELISRDPHTNASYRVVVGFVNNRLVEVVDKKGIVWMAEEGPAKVHDECLRLAGIREQVMEAQAKNRNNGW